MINTIFAVDQNGSMGFNGTLPWPHNAADMTNFKNLTNRHVVVMGRKTWDDPKMPKPLPGRTPYVASNRPVSYAGRISGNLVNEILALEQKHPEQIIWVIGGPTLIQECSGILDNVYLTHFKGIYKSDTRIDLKAFLKDFVPTSAQVAPDYKSTLVTYVPLFNRLTANN